MRGSDAATVSTTAPFLQWRADAACASGERRVPIETAIGLAYDSEPYVVLMGSPADLEDLGVGFTVSERLARATDILDVRIDETEAGPVVDMMLSPKASRALRAARRRTLESRSSCGLCGIEDLRAALRPPAPVGDGFTLPHATVSLGLTALERSQPLGAETRATHAAAWMSRSGEPVLVREDVGRHTALDKAIGAGARAGLDPAEYWLLVTSRASYEMVDKAAAAGAQILASVSAPTSLAIEHARSAGLTLVSVARADGHAVFACPERLTA